MDRRKVLKGLGLGLSAGMLPGWLASCADEGVGPEILYDGVVGIIGAGAAGLLAADILQTKGVKVRIFEASDRIGGRVRQLKALDELSDSLYFSTENFPVADYPIELGADQIFGSNSRLGMELGFLKVPVTNIYDNFSDYFIADGEFKSGTDLAGDGDFIAAKTFRSGLQNLTNSSSTVQQEIQTAGINSRMHPILNSWIGNLYGTSNSRLGAGDVARALQSGDLDDARLILTNNPMQNILASRFSKVIAKVELNKMIQSVAYDGDKVILTDSNSTQDEVDKVIIAVPLSILKSNAITFNPGLPSSKTDAMGRMTMDTSIRVYLEFSRNFWAADAAFIYGGTVCPSYFGPGLDRAKFDRGLSLTINGSKAEELSALGTDMIPQILEELDGVFEGKASAYIRRDDNDNALFVIKDWSKDTHIKGGYSYPMANAQETDREDLAAQIDGKLFFAGEATDVNGQWGTISGAMLSGERSAMEVAESIIGGP